MYVEEACEVILAASGQEVVSDSCCLDAENAAMQNEDLRLLLELSSSEFGDSNITYHVRLASFSFVNYDSLSCRFMP